MFLRKCVLSSAMSILGIVVSTLLLFSNNVWAAAPFVSAATSFKTDFMLLAQILVGLGIGAVGLMCVFGKINKLWLVACVIGIVLVFGADQIITWIRGAAGV
jgi:type IV secretion system protein VirB2